MIILFQLLQFMKLLYNLVYCFTIYNYSYYVSQLLTGKFCHGIWNEAGQRLIEFCQENALVIPNITRRDATHGHYQMVNTKIRLIIFFAAKDGEALCSQQKQDQELTVAQIMNSLLPNSGLN